MANDEHHDDSDDDGISDGAEFTGDTDPTKQDTDGDGLNDGDELDVGSDPTAVDSDGDGLNDVFPPHGINITSNEYLFMIFNRWGELLFESKEPLEAWDGKYRGKLVPNDVYIWKLEYVDDNGDLQNQIGNVTIVR